MPPGTTGFRPKSTLFFRGLCFSPDTRLKIPAIDVSEIRFAGLSSVSEWFVEGWC